MSNQKKHGTPPARHGGQNPPKKGVAPGKKVSDKGAGAGNKPKKVKTS